METSPGDTERTKISYDREKQICRCCLTTEKRMKSAVEVQQYFMELTGINVSVSDGMPVWVCVECSALMRKAISFKYKMLRAHSVLYEYLLKCTRGPVDPRTPDLARYKTPHLSATKVLAFDNFHENIGYHDLLQQEKKLSNSELNDVPLLPLFETPQTAFESVEAAFSDYEDDPLEHQNGNTEEEDEGNSEEEVEDEEEEDLEEEEEEEEDNSEEDSEESVKCEPKVKRVKSDKNEVTKNEISTEHNNITDVSWTSANDKILIEFVRRNEALYNPKNDMYKIAVLKQKLWRDVGEILNKTESDCYKRWCYVRDYYIRRRGKARGGEAAKRRAQLLAFLDGVPSPQRSWVPSASSKEEVKMETHHVSGPDPWENIRIGEQFSKMSNEAWNGDTDDVLIELVRRNEVLYNPRCKDFRKVHLKQKLWREIGLKLNKTESACYKRWCYVRDYYVRRKANPGALSTGKAAKRRADTLAFLDNISCTQRPTQQDSDTLKSESTQESTQNSQDVFANFTPQRYRIGVGYSPKSSSKSWSADSDDALIDYVRQHDALYNPKSKDFRKTLLKQRLWIEIGRRLNRTDTDCCRRWCYVRDYYIRRRGKAGVLSTGKAAKRRADRLTFLDNVPSTSKSGHNVQEQDESLKSSHSEPCEIEQSLNEYTQVQQDIRVPEYSNMSTNISWTSEDDETLIGFVRRNETLYNPKSRKTELKQKLWSDIASILNRTDCDCYKRWCYVRDYYIRRRGKARGGEAAKRRAQLLAFLDGVPSPQRNNS